MSAFIVDRSHINAMLQAAFSAGRHDQTNFSWYHDTERHELTHENADRIGQMLLDENITSVQYRYDDSPLTDLPGRVDADYLLPFQWHVMGKTPKPIEAIKVIHCYVYQACEHPEWQTSEAQAFCDALIHATVRMIDGYDNAPWVWEEKLV